MTTTLNLTGVPGLSDWRDRIDESGNIRNVIELLTRAVPLLTDIPFMEGNLPNGLTTSVRTGLPKGTWRNFNEGVDKVKTARASMTVTTGMYEAYNEVDKSLADLGGNAAAFRGDEAKATMDGMGQDMCEAFIYADENEDPKQFFGLQKAYSTLDVDDSASAENVIDMGGREANKQQSIYLVGWGGNTITGVVPRGTPAGLQFRDLGEDTAVLDGGKMLQVYRSHFCWHAGLAVRDWRYCVRIANCGKTEANGASALFGRAFEDPTQMGSRGADKSAVDGTRLGVSSVHSDFWALPDILARAVELIPSAGQASLVFYMRRDAMSVLRTISNRSVGQSTLTWEMFEGRPRYSFMGVPIRQLDTLRTNEPVVTA